MSKQIASEIIKQFGGLIFSIRSAGATELRMLSYLIYLSCYNLWPISARERDVTSSQKELSFIQTCLNLDNCLTILKAVLL